MALHDEVPRIALAVYAHPDDPEVSCGGTLARWAAAGTAVHMLVCNAGDKGSLDAAANPLEVADVRAAEVSAAAGVMGVTGFELLGYPDGEIENTVDLRHELVECLRRTRPDVVVAPDPTAVFFGDAYVNHHDHRSVGWAVLDACAPMSASPLYFPDAGPPHRVATVLLSGTLEPDYWVDIGATIETKVAAVGCHRSQLAAGDEGEAVVAEVVRARAEEAGKAAGVRYAEGFRRLVLAR
jgi:LmbE family N-acetylglucosaminyl deacetylase